MLNSTIKQQKHIYVRSGPVWFGPVWSGPDLVRLIAIIDLYTISRFQPMILNIEREKSTKINMLILMSQLIKRVEMVIISLIKNNYSN